MTQDFSSLIDANPTTELATLKDAGNIALWDHDKKKEFADTFDKRIRVARFVLMETAYGILRTALGRHFIGLQHIIEVLPDAKHNPEYYITSWHHQHLLDKKEVHVDCDAHHTIGDRGLDDLRKVAEERTEVILKELPPIKQAVSIIDPETAEMMDKRDALLEKARSLTPKLDELTEPIQLSEVDQKMTIGAFRAQIKIQMKQRDRLIERLNQIGEQGSELEDAINKRLFKGLPGLSDAVVDVAKNHLERAAMLDQLNRRVGEQVLFGDSKEAMDLLARFEQDETRLSKNVKEQFQAALAKLKLSKAQLGAKRK